jgi:hypothetical protein
MGEEIREILEENQRLIKENLALSRSNEKKIKSIRANLRRSFWGKIMYWVVIIGIAAGSFYYLNPYINEARDTYNSFKENVDRSSEIIKNPSHLFDNVSVFKNLFGE